MHPTGREVVVGGGKVEGRIELGVLVSSVVDFRKIELGVLSSGVVDFGIELEVDVSGVFTFGVVDFGLLASDVADFDFVNFVVVGEVVVPQLKLSQATTSPLWLQYKP